jgi:hypothetical protein
MMPRVASARSIGAEQRRFQQLQVAMIARGQLRRHCQGLRQAAERGRGAAAHQLEHVRIALLRHDGRAGGHRRGQRDVAELLAAEQDQVGGQPAEVLHQQVDLEHQLRLGLAARQLHRGDRLVDGGEAEASRVCSRSSGSPGAP